MVKVMFLVALSIALGLLVSFGVTAGLLYLGSLAFPYEWSWGLSIGVWAILMLLSFFFKSNNTIKINKD